MLRRRSRACRPALTPVCPAGKAVRPAAVWATCCAVAWADFSAAPPPEPCSMAGSAVSSQMQESGQGDAARSWIGTGPNKQITQGDLANALGGDTLDELSQHSGMDRDDLLSGLSKYLPG